MAIHMGFLKRPGLALLFGLIGLVTLGSAAEKAATAGHEQGDAAAQAKPDKPLYVRIHRDAAEKPLAMETAVVEFRPATSQKGGVRVDLIAAVHVAEKDYYTELNKRFKAYDAVLYELVAPEGARVPQAGQGGGSPVSMLQKGLKRMLGLEFQLDLIDYKAKNLVHADMSPEEFARSMKERGESFWTMFWRMMVHGMKQQGAVKGNQPSDFEILMALFDKDRSVVLKRVVAEQLSDLEGSVAAIEGPKGSTLVSGRNQKALEVLRREIDGGKRKLAIFYGAAHMPDFQTRLAADFGLTPSKTEWLKAWDLADPPKKETPAKKEAVAQ